MAPERCSYKECKRRYPTGGVSMHKFPTSDDLCKQWVINCGNSHLQGISHENLSRKYLICDDHFAESWKIKRGSRQILQPGAVPIPWENNTTPGESSGRKTNSPIMEMSAPNPPTFRTTRRNSDAAERSSSILTPPLSDTSSPGSKGECSSSRQLSLTPTPSTSGSSKAEPCSSDQPPPRQFLSPSPSIVSTYSDCTTVTNDSNGGGSLSDSGSGDSFPKCCVSLRRLTEWDIIKYRCKIREDAKGNHLEKRTVKAAMAREKTKLKREMDAIKVYMGEQKWMKEERQTKERVHYKEDSEDDEEIRPRKRAALKRSRTSEEEPVLERKKKRRNNNTSQGEFVAAMITNHWHVNGMWHYEVQWKGFPPSEATYEPHKNLTDVTLLLADYYKKWYGRPGTDEVNQQLEILRAAVDLNTVEDSSALEILLTDLNYSFKEDFREVNLDSFENKVVKDLTAAATCMALMNRPSAPDDEELRAKGVAFATIEALISRRRDQLVALKTKEQEITNMEEAPIFLENNQDFDFFPDDVKYISKMVLGEGVVLNEDPPIFCECNPCDGKSECCGDGPKNPYNSLGRLRSLDQIPIYECNRKCKCPPSCKKRVVQHGRQVPLTIFKTPDCGWGVKATKRIARGTYLCEYLGEMVTAAVSNAREPEYSIAKHDYVFDVDYVESENGLEAEYSVDATHMGNIARFINHGCQPNSIVQPVWVDCLHPCMHKLTIFSLREIRAGEEIRFDYSSGIPPKPGDPKMIAKSFCLCGADTCRKILFNKGQQQPSSDDEDTPLSRVVEKVNSDETDNGTTSVVAVEAVEPIAIPGEPSAVELIIPLLDEFSAREPALISDEISTVEPVLVPDEFSTFEPTSVPVEVSAVDPASVSDKATAVEPATVPDEVSSIEPAKPDEAAEPEEDVSLVNCK